MRADRVLRGDGTFDDLNALFLWLRFNSFGNAAVKDVGDFVGHADARNQGEAWRSLRNFATTFFFHFRRNDLQEARPHSELAAAARAALDAAEPAEVRKDTGLSYRKAKAALERGLSGVYQLGTGFRASPYGLAPKDLEVLKHYGSVIYVRAAFTDNDLLTQFLTALTKNGLLVGPTKFSDRLLPQLALFTILKMHLAVVPLPEEKLATLYAAADQPAGEPNLSVAAQMPNPKGGENTIGTPVFATSLPAKEFCEPELLDIPRWDFPIELNAAGRLQMFV